MRLTLLTLLGFAYVYYNFTKNSTVVAHVQLGYMQSEQKHCGIMTNFN